MPPPNIRDLIPGTISAGNPTSSSSLPSPPAPTTNTNATSGMMSPTIVEPTWNGSIPQGWHVCDSSANNITIKTCELNNGTMQMHNGTAMCLLNMSDSNAWSQLLGNTNIMYNFSWGVAPLESECFPLDHSGALRTTPDWLLLLVLFVVAVLAT